MRVEVPSYLSCEADFDTEGGWNGDDPDDKQPPGKDLAEFLHSVLKTNSASEVWNEEGYGWSFNCKVEQITINVLVGHSDRWLIILSVVSFLPAFLRLCKYNAALQKACDVVDAAVRNDSRFRNLLWSTAADC